MSILTAATTYFKSVRNCCRFLIAFSYELSKKEGRVGKDLTSSAPSPAICRFLCSSNLTQASCHRHARAPAFGPRVVGVPKLLEVCVARYFVEAQNQLVDQGHLVSTRVPGIHSNDLYASRGSSSCVCLACAGSVPSLFTTWR